MLYDVYGMICNGFDMVLMSLTQSLKRKPLKLPKIELEILGKPYMFRTIMVYGPLSGNKNLIKLFLDETKLLVLSKHINYKSIGLVLREIYFLKFT